MQSRIGCFPNVNTDLTEIQRDNMTIQTCITLCREPPHETRYAVLRAGNTCRCQDGRFSRSNKLEDLLCNIPCAGDPYDICGGPRNRVSVYDGKYL